MLDDFKPITWKFDKEIQLKPIADPHIGNGDFNEYTFLKTLDYIENTPNCYGVFVGDLLDNTLKSSKGNCYENAMRPYEQKKYLINKLRPIIDKTLGAVPRQP